LWGVQDQRLDLVPQIRGEFGQPSSLLFLNLTDF